MPVEQPSYFGVTRVHRSSRPDIIDQRDVQEIRELSPNSHDLIAVFLFANVSPRQTGISKDQVGADSVLTSNT